MRAGADGPAQPRPLLRGCRPPDGAPWPRRGGSRTESGPRRFPIRYATQRWTDGKWLYGGLFVVGLVLIAFNLYERRQILSFVPVTVLCGVILVAFWLMQRFSYLEIADDGLRVRYLLRHLELPYDALARGRRRPLEVAFQPAERRRFVNRFVRRLGREPAAYIRLDRRQPDLVESAERKLGPRLVAGADIVVPIARVDEFVAEIKNRVRGQDRES